MTNELQTNKPAGSFGLKAAKVLGIFVLVLLTLFGALIIAAYALESTIKQKIVTEINAQVTVPVQVKGGIDFSVLRHFPYASVTFKNVEIDDRLRKEKKLIAAEEFSLLCNLVSLFGDKIEFSSLVVSNGQLNLYTNEAGKNNFDIFKPSENSSSQAIQIKKAQIKNIAFSLTDKTQNTVIATTLKDIVLRGNFGEKLFELDAFGQLFVGKLNIGGEPYMNEKNVAIDASMQVNKLTKKYSFNRGKVTIENAEFSITGFFTRLKAATQLDFNLKNSGQDIRELFALLPEKIRTSFSEAEGSGEYAIEAYISGTVSKNSLPKVNVSASLKDSELKFGKYNKFLKKVNASANYESGERGNNKLIISNFNCTLNDQPFQFRLTLTDLSNPTFDFYANGVLHFGELSSLIPDSVLQEPDGKIHFNNFHLKGRKSDFTDTDNSTLDGRGDFRLESAEFRQNGITYGNINGLLKYENKIIEAQNFTLNFLSTDFTFSGTIKNLLAFVYNLSSKRKANDVVLGVNGKVSMNTFNLSGIIEAYDKKNRPVTQQRQKVNIRDIFNMQGNLQLDIKRFVYKKMDFASLSALLQVAPGMVRVNSLQAQAMGGEVRMSGLVSFLPDNALNINCDISAVEMDIPKIFAQCENFGQATLTDKHIKGTVSTSITMNATWLNYKELDQNTLSAIVDFNIKKGQLVKFEPLRAASKFIRVEELEDIRFADLSNTIRIADKRIDIPQFEIKSSALNLMFSGYHYFDNKVDYHIKVNLHKVLAQKFNRNSKEVQYIENDPYEGLNLYLSMSGPLDNPTIKYDKASTRNKIKEDFRKEKEELRNLLKGTTPKVDENEKKREEKYFDVKEQPQFMDFEED
jgi:hypothetical protein